MSAHYGESFTDATISGWGWQCLTPGCNYEATGLDDIAAADALGDNHLRLSMAADRPPRWAVAEAFFDAADTDTAADIRGAAWRIYAEREPQAGGPS